MDPVANTKLALALKAGSKASELCNALLKQVIEEKSRIRIFFGNLINKPFSWISQLIFSPLYIALAIHELIFAEKRLGIVEKLRLTLLSFGIFAGASAVWFAGTLFCGLAGAFIIYNLFGILSALCFLVGSMISIILLVVIQIVIFNLVCHLFLTLARPEIIEQVLKRNSIYTNELVVLSKE